MVYSEVRYPIISIISCLPVHCSSAPRQYRSRLTVIAQSCGPEVDRGRCPNLFFCVAMFAILVPQCLVVTVGIDDLHTAFVQVHTYLTYIHILCDVKLLSDSASI